MILVDSWNCEEAASQIVEEERHNWGALREALIRSASFDEFAASNKIAAAGTCRERLLRCTRRRRNWEALIRSAASFDEFDAPNKIAAVGTGRERLLGCTRRRRNWEALIRSAASFDEFDAPNKIAAAGTCR